MIHERTAAMKPGAVHRLDAPHVPRAFNWAAPGAPPRYWPQLTRKAHPIASRVHARSPPPLSSLVESSNKEARNANATTAL